MTLKDYILLSLSSQETEYSNSRLSKMRKWYHQNIASYTFTRAENGFWYLFESTFCSQYSGKIFLRSERVLVLNCCNLCPTVSWARDELPGNAFRCTATGKYYKIGPFNYRIVRGHVYLDTLCGYNEDTAHYYLLSDSAPMQYDNSVNGYHTQAAPWRNLKYEKRLLFGCEIELYSKVPRSLIASAALKCGFLSERDGSLDREHGIEVIMPPATLAEHQDPNGKWMRFFSMIRGKALGKNAPSGHNYGIHVSINRQALSTLHVGKLIIFIHSNPSLCQLVAGRSETEYSEFKQKRFGDARANEGNKYEAIALRSSTRIELRIFRSNVRPEGFLRAVEFTAAAVAFTQDTSCKKLDETAFRAWLARPENSQSYKNLISFLNS